MYNPNLVNNYRRPPQPGNPRQTEAWALTEAALRLKQAREGDNTDQMVDAARLNWRLWTIFQADLLEPDCPVPDDIRTNVLTLANFVDRQTVDFLTAPVPDKLDILITINRNLAAGLYTEPQDSAAEPASETQPAGLAQGISA